MVQKHRAAVSSHHREWFTKIVNFFCIANKPTYCNCRLNPPSLHKSLCFTLGRRNSMASPAQITANRLNAQRSTGPKTSEGIQASSRNAIRHGLTGTQIVMPGEDAAAYEELRKGMSESYKPATEAERVIVDQIAANAWRLMRAQRIETAFFAKLAEGADDPDAAIAAAFIDRPKDVARMHRYVTAANNAYFKALRELARLQKERPHIEEAVSEEPENEIGFISYAESQHTGQERQTPLQAPLTNVQTRPRTPIAM